MVDKVKVAVFGATGLVGQRFVSILADHPWFEVAELAASKQRAGQRYADTVNWVLGSSVPDPVVDIRLKPVDPDAVEEAEVVFIALPKEVATEVEPQLAKKGKIVVSNASNFRLEPDVPLLNPEINHDHIFLLREQRRRRGWSGAILKVPNCSTAILTLSLKPLVDSYGVEKVFVTTMQAISGAGFKGVPGYMITDNIVPYIRGEEEKMINETRKILGRLEDGKVRPLDIEVYPTTTRVPVLDGHLESVHTVLAREPGGIEEVERVFSEWRSLPQEAGLPTAPEQPIVVRREPDRPQPRLDRDNGRGMSVTVGRIKLYGKGLLRYLVLGHNTVRGAAGTGVLIAELYHYYMSKGLL
jgi:aspartate-semialdehyde dehydrogenase